MVAVFPEDVLYKIFTTAYDELRMTFRDGLKELNLEFEYGVRSTTPHEELVVRLSAVCHSWKAIIESSPLLWTEVTCPLGDSDRADAIALRRLERAITFSQPHAISVRLALDTSYACYGDTGISLPMQSLMPHLHRIDSFIAAVKHTPNFTTDPPVKGQKDRAPTKSTIPKLSDNFRTLWRTNPANLLSRINSSDDIPFRNVHTLVLRDVLFTRLSHLVFLLQHCSQLESLILHGVAHNMIVDKQPNTYFNLPELMQMDVDSSHLSIMTRSGLRTPSLLVLQLRKVESESLQATCNHDGNCAHHDDIDWDFATGLKHLVLQGYYDADATHILHDLPELSHLTVVASQSGAFLARVLCNPVPTFVSPGGFYLPKLEKLTLLGGELDDEDVRSLLDERDSTKHPQLKTLNMKFLACHNLTKKTVEELARRGRGSCELVELRT